MIVYREYEIQDVWIEEPRWSWFGSPLYQCDATQLIMKAYEPDPHLSQIFLNQATTGPSLSDWVRVVTFHHLYFKKDEFVMWKMHGMEDENGNYNINDIRKGIFYS